jgi:hypothetical protein
MSKFQKLAKINKIANECVQDGDFVLASKFHSEFMKIAQVDDAKDILRMKIARGMGYEANVSDEELFANIIRISDYIAPERLKNPQMGSNPRNVLTSDMAGATPQNSYKKEYWDNCARSLNKSSIMFRSRLEKNAEALRNAARSGNMDFVFSVFGKN